MRMHARIRRVGKATRSAGSSTSEGGSVPTATKMVGTSQALLCPPYKSSSPAQAMRALHRFPTRQLRGIADRKNVCLVRFHCAALEHRRARDKSIGSGGGQLARHIGADAAVHLDI